VLNAAKYTLSLLTRAGVLVGLFDAEAVFGWSCGAAVSPIRSGLSAPSPGVPAYTDFVIPLASRILAQEKYVNEPQRAITTLYNKIKHFFLSSKAKWAIILNTNVLNSNLSLKILYYHFQRKGSKVIQQSVRSDRTWKFSDQSLCTMIICCSRTE
jgi:hypothetical protein